LLNTVDTICIDLLLRQFRHGFLDEFSIIQWHLALLNKLQHANCSDQFGARSNPKGGGLSIHRLLGVYT